MVQLAVAYKKLADGLDTKKVVLAAAAVPRRCKDREERRNCRKTSNGITVASSWRRRQRGLQRSPSKPVVKEPSKHESYGGGGGRGGGDDGDDGDHDGDNDGDDDGGHGDHGEDGEDGEDGKDDEDVDDCDDGGGGGGGGSSSSTGTETLCSQQLLQWQSLEDLVGDHTAFPNLEEEEARLPVGEKTTKRHWKRHACACAYVT